MSKIITDKEMLDIVARVVDGEIEMDSDNYKVLLDNLATVITETFGGLHTYPDYIGDALGYAVSFRITEDVPDDGGVYAKYDTDVKWINGREEE